MKFDVVFNASALNANVNRTFSVHHLADGTPCIQGSNANYASMERTSVFVFAPEGGRTKMHPIVNGICLYEVHLGDMVAVYEVGGSVGELQIYSLRIVEINDTTVTTVPVII